MSKTHFLGSCMTLNSVILILVFSVNLGFANYVGNPEAPELPKIISYTRNMTYAEQDYWLNAKLDYEKEYMSDMNLEYISGSPHHRVQYSNFYGNYLTLTANFLKRIDFYAKAGAVNPFFQLALPSDNGVGNNNLTNRKTIPAWGLGAKFLVFKLNRVSFGVESSYFQTDHRNFILFTAVPIVSPAHTTTSWYNWQVSSALSLNLCPLIPYAGAKYSRTVVTLDQSTPAVPIKPIKFDNRRKFGFFLGCTFLASRYLEMNFEGRFIDEQAFSATLGFRF